MKKLMIAAAIVCAAAFAQAATYTWNLGSGTIKDGYNKAEGNIGTATCYIFNSKDFSQAKLIEALATSTLADVWAEHGMIDIKDDGGVVTKKGAPTITTSNGKNTATSSEFANAGTAVDGYINAYYAVMSPDNDYVFIAKEISKQVQDSDVTKLAFGSASTPSASMGSTSNYAAGGWYSVVPEPTSGLLLLLGVAGLALRRRRA